MLSKLRRRAEDEKGFTLIELLVVILIIGILAAIAIPAFLSQRQKAYDAQVKSNINSAQTAEETYSTDNDGSYVTDTLSANDSGGLAAIEPSLKNAPFVTAVATTSPAGYTLTATSAGSNPVTYVLTQADGAVTRTCAPAGQGGCSTGSTW